MSVKPGNFYNESLASEDFIRLDGTSTTTASIPFTLGLSVPDNQKIVIGDNSGGDGNVSIRMDSTTTNDVLWNRENGGLTPKINFGNLNVWIGSSAAFGSTTPTRLQVGMHQSSDTTYISSTNPLLVRGENAATQNITVVKIDGLYTSTASTSGTQNALNPIMVYNSTTNLTSNPSLVSVRAEIQTGAAASGTITGSTVYNAVFTDNASSVATFTDFSFFKNSTSAWAKTTFTRRSHIWLLNNAAFSSTGSSGTDFGVRIEKLTRATANYEIALDLTGGIFFNTPTVAGLEYIRSDATSRLDIGANTNIDFNVGGSEVATFATTGLSTGQQITSTVSTGTAPLVIASTTLVTNLNADMVDSLHVATSGSAIPNMAAGNTWSGQQTFATQVQLNFTSLGADDFFIVGNEVLSNAAGIFRTSDNSSYMVFSGTSTNINSLPLFIGSGSVGAPLFTVGFNNTGLYATGSDQLNVASDGVQVFQFSNGGRNTSYQPLTVNENSATALLVEQTGVNSNTLVADTSTGSVSVNQAISSTAALAVTENTNSRILELTRSASTTISQLKSIYVQETWTMNQGNPSPGAVVLHFGIIDNRVTNTAGSGDIVSPVYVNVSRGTATASSTKALPGLNMFINSVAESASMTYSGNTVTYTTGFFLSNIAHGQSNFSFTWSGTTTFTQVNRWADANVQFNPTITGGGTYRLNNYNFSSRGTGTTTGDTYSVGFYHSATGFDVNWGYVNETTTNHNSFGGDNTKNYRGTGSGTVALRTLAPDVYDTYNGTSWLFEHEIVAASAAFSFNSLVADVDFTVGGDTDTMFHLDAGGGLSYFQVQVADTATAFALQDSAGNSDLVYDSSTPKLSFLNGALFVTDGVDVFSRFGGAWTSSSITASDTADRLVVSKIGSNTGNQRAGLIVSEHTASSSFGAGISSLNAFCILLGAQNYTASTLGGGLRGARYVSSHEGTGTITQGSSITGLIRTTNTSGTITDAYVFHVEGSTITAGTTITRGGGLWVRNGANSGTYGLQTGVRIDALSAATDNAAITIGGTGLGSAIYFNATTAVSTEYIYASAASTLDLNSNTTMNLRIGTTSEVILTATQLDLMSATTDRVNFIGGDGATAPSTTLTPTFTSYYGGNTNALGDPVEWLDIKINGTARKIPTY